MAIHPRNLLVWLAYLSVVLWNAERAFAQPGIPKLITTERLEDYFSRYLVLSEAQTIQIKRIQSNI
jgi:hypothetical protein